MKETHLPQGSGVQLVHLYLQQRRGLREHPPYGSPGQRFRDGKVLGKHRTQQRSDGVSLRTHAPNSSGLSLFGSTCQCTQSSLRRAWFSGTSHVAPSFPSLLPGAGTEAQLCLPREGWQPTPTPGSARLSVLGRSGLPTFTPAHKCASSPSAGDFLLSAFMTRLGLSL